MLKIKDFILLGTGSFDESRGLAEGVELLGSGVVNLGCR